MKDIQKKLEAELAEITVSWRKEVVRLESLEDTLVFGKTYPIETDLGAFVKVEFRIPLIKKYIEKLEDKGREGTQTSEDKVELDHAKFLLESSMKNTNALKEKIKQIKSSIQEKENRKLKIVEELSKIKEKIKHENESKKEVSNPESESNDKNHENVEPNIYQKALAARGGYFIVSDNNLKQEIFDGYVKKITSSSSLDELDNNYQVVRRSIERNDKRYDDGNKEKLKLLTTYAKETQARIIRESKNNIQSLLVQFKQQLREVNSVAQVSELATKARTEIATLVNNSHRDGPQADAEMTRYKNLIIVSAKDKIKSINNAVQKKVVAAKSSVVETAYQIPSFSLVSFFSSWMWRMVGSKTTQKQARNDATKEEGSVEEQNRSTFLKRARTYAGNLPSTLWGGSQERTRSSSSVVILDKIEVSDQTFSGMISNQS